MATDVNRLKNAINDIMDDYDNVDYNDKAAKRADFSEKLATAIINEITNARVVYTSGLMASSVPVTGTINHTII